MSHALQCGAHAPQVPSCVSVKPCTQTSHPPGPAPSHCLQRAPHAAHCELFVSANPAWHSSHVDRSPSAQRRHLGTAQRDFLPRRRAALLPELDRASARPARASTTPRRSALRYDIGAVVSSTLAIQFLFLFLAFYLSIVKYPIPAIQFLFFIFLVLSQCDPEVQRKQRKKYCSRDYLSLSSKHLGPRLGLLSVTLWLEGLAPLFTGFAKCHNLTFDHQLRSV